MDDILHSVFADGVELGIESDRDRRSFQDVQIVKSVRFPDTTEALTIVAEDRPGEFSADKRGGCASGGIAMLCSCGTVLPWNGFGSNDGAAWIVWPASSTAKSAAPPTGWREADYVPNLADADNAANWHAAKVKDPEKHPDWDYNVGSKFSTMDVRF